jgi:enamine deaminase RidA (YjgF/YER057c/UK114 family)
LKPVSWSPGLPRRIGTQALGCNRAGPVLAPSCPKLPRLAASLQPDRRCAKTWRFVERPIPVRLWRRLGEIHYFFTMENIMAGLVDKKLTDLGIVLPVPATPIANYLGFVRTGSLLVVSGQLCLDAGGKLLAKGKLGQNVSIEDGQKAARACAVNLLGQVRAAAGDLDKVVRVVRLGGFINSDPTFADGPKVMNGASDLMVEVFGDKGRHARSTVGVAALPLDAAVEVEGLFELA